MLGIRIPQREGANRAGFGVSQWGRGLKRLELSPSFKILDNQYRTYA